MQAAAVSDGSVRQTLSALRGKRLFFDPLCGNNGDTLIRMGAESLFRRFHLDLVGDPAEAECIVVNGGGGMNNFWQGGLNALRYYNTAFRDIPLLVLPSSYQVEAADLAALFALRRAPAHLYAREQYSLDLLSASGLPGAITLGLDHDLAFALEDTTYLKGLRARRADKHILIVERGDLESTTGLRHRIYLKDGMRERVPQRVRYAIKRGLLALTTPRTPRSPFARTHAAWARREYPQLRKLPIYVDDISENGRCSFARFSRLIAEAALVITTRLHVAILGGMLGKPTHMFGGTYHKIAGVYEYSLHKVPHVQLHMQ